MALHVNYCGYVEGRDINRARADVVVTDGFTGNVTLKTMEGFASFLLGNLREVFGNGMLRRILFFLFFRRRIGSIRYRLDPAEYGGAPLLGVNGVAIIAHGSSNARAIRNAMRAAANEALVRHVNSEIVDVLRATPVTLLTKPPSGRGIRGVLERMRERLHAGRDMHASNRPEPFPDPAFREAVPVKREGVSSSSATSKTGPMSLDGPRVEATSSHKPSIERTALSNGSQPASESGSDETAQPADHDSRPVKPA
jgi:hypothetical protein